MQEKNAVHESEDRRSVPISKEDAQERSLRAFKNVLEGGSKITLDHYLVYFTRKLLSDSL